MENAGTEKSNESKQDIVKRLRKIEGQVKGIQKMIEEEKPCSEILTQIAAIRAAINKVGGIILAKYSRTCIENALLSEDRERDIEELMKTIQKFLRFVD
ncbi:MAG TPA: metal-sensitive transcriptional regulator [Clostridiaceae bacterium]|nr:metal-sensitive transcriptional regulator [Clostridiaceae bacterium]